MTHGTQRLGLRRSEWACLAFFCYVTCLLPFFHTQLRLCFQPLLIALCIFLILVFLSQLEKGKWAFTVNHVRDWLLPFVTLIAFQQMELFRPQHFPHYYEPIWVQQDFNLLHTWHLQRILESFGSVIPFYLELCYLLVYGFPFYCIGILYARHLRKFIDFFLVVYMAGTLGVYALFPFFPSQPPRLLYPNVAAPHFASWVRHFNLFLLNKGSIHSSVFPSAHVSSAFSAAWAMFIIQPKRRVLSWTLVLYAVSVSLATIYGRYHYTADVIAGIGVSILAGIVCAIVAAGQWVRR